MLQDTCKVAPLLDKVKTMLYFCAGFESILRKYSIEVLEVTWCNVKPLECVSEFIDRQIIDEILKRAECVSDFACVSNVVDCIERSCSMNVTDCSPEITLRI